MGVTLFPDWDNMTDITVQFEGESIAANVNNHIICLNHFETYEELATAIERFIHFYNHQRRQHRLDCLAPMDYRGLLEAA